jgi:hypothetical protein
MRGDVLSLDADLVIQDIALQDIGVPGSSTIVRIAAIRA